MHFTITNMDKPDSLALRAATRETHLGYLDSIVGVLVAGGAFLNADGKPIGSLLIVDAPDEAAAQAIAAGDPYAKAGLFETVTVTRYRLVYKDGARIA
jgi:uncharacterized protein YciI